MSLSEVPMVNKLDADYKSPEELTEPIYQPNVYKEPTQTKTLQSHI